MPEMMGIGPDGKWKTIAVDENGNILASGIGGGGGGGGDASAANQVTQTTALNNIRNEQATASEQAAQTAVLGNILTANQSPRPDLVVGPSSITTIVATLNTGGANIVNQAVGISGLDGRATVAIQITGTHTGVLTVQGRLDGTNWVNLGGASVCNISTGASTATIASAAQGIFIVDTSGFSEIRVAGLAARTGTAYVTMRATSGNAQVAIDAPLPAGSSQIGTVGLVAGETVIGKAGGMTTIPAASQMTRPADTTAYTVGDLIANSVTAGSVAALSFAAARINAGSGMIVGARLQKSATSVTNAAFRLHLFTTVPTFTSAGDNSAISSVVQGAAKNYLGYIDIPSMIQFQDCAWGTGAPDNSQAAVPFVAGAGVTTVFGVLEARGAYTPASAETWNVSLMVMQD